MPSCSSCYLPVAVFLEPDAGTRPDGENSPWIQMATAPANPDGDSQPDKTKEVLSMEPAEQDDVQSLCQMVLARGACAARVIDPAQVVTGDWVRFKCQYGCREYNRNPTCPPFSPPPSATRKILSHYSVGILFELPEGYTEAARLCLESESIADQLGLHGAAVMGAGPCSFLSEYGDDEQCPRSETVRPSMKACGIDVQATARKAGLSAHGSENGGFSAERFGLLLVV